MTTKCCIYNVNDTIAKSKYRIVELQNIDNTRVLVLNFVFFDFDYAIYQKHTTERGSPVARINMQTQRFFDLIDLSVQLADFKFVNLDMLTKVLISAMRLNKALIVLFSYRKNLNITINKLRAEQVLYRLFHRGRRCGQQMY